MRYNRTLRFAIAMVAFVFLRCSSNSSSQEIPNSLSNVNWLTNSTARFFRLGVTNEDTLLEIYFDSNTILQKFHKGRNPQLFNQYTHISNLKNPTKTVVLTSAFSRFLSQLGQLPTIVAVDELNFWTKDIISQIPNASQTLQIQKGGNLQYEKLIKIEPDWVINYTLTTKTDPKITSHSPVIYIQNHFEVHPLAKAEWIKVFGFCFNQISLADSLFQVEKSLYDGLSGGQTPTAKPKIMVNLPYSGIWWVPQKYNSLTQLIYDAGGEPIWITDHLNGNNSVQISTENALNHIANCDILLHPGSIKSMDEINDPRIQKTLFTYKPKIWQNDLKIESNGANPYWDMGSAQPHLLLRELRSIFYDQNQNPYFYRQIKFN